MSDPQRTGAAASDELLELAGGAAAGDAGAAERLCALLMPPVQAATRHFLPADDEADDVVQETLVAVLEYLRRDGGFTGNLASFATTIARNRCRNLLAWRRRRPQVPIESLAEWLGHPEHTALDVLLDAELLQLLQGSLDALGEECRALLRGFYLEGRSIEELRRAAGLTTVQGVYYRRSLCLDRAAILLKARLAECSSAGADAAGPTAEGGPTS